MPVISFLVCTRNRADIVFECVCSLLAASRRDFELIVRDNFSTDNTLELLKTIKDDRLKIYCASENQGTLTFYEASKVAAGEIVTWLSDEDNFQFEHLDYILEQFRQDSDCNVIFGGIIVGAKAREVKYPDAIVTNVVLAHITALSFSGCGGLFVRRAALSEVNSFNVVNSDDGYALWNYYPVGFFASRCLVGTLRSTSRIVVIQKRFAHTTNNWSNVSSTKNFFRAPHYYPESIFDRLSTNIVNIWFKSLPLIIKLEITQTLLRNFFMQTTNFANPMFSELLYENYSKKIVQAYLDHIKTMNLNVFTGRHVWALRKVIFSLPLAILHTWWHWQRLSRAKK